jgi:hypothetical protein
MATITREKISEAKRIYVEGVDAYNFYGLWDDGFSWIKKDGSPSRENMNLVIDYSNTVSTRDSVLHGIFSYDLEKIPFDSICYISTKRDFKNHKHEHEIYYFSKAFEEKYIPLILKDMQKVIEKEKKENGNDLNIKVTFIYEPKGLTDFKDLETIVKSILKEGWEIKRELSNEEIEKIKNLKFYSHELKNLETIRKEEGALKDILSKYPDPKIYHIKFSEGYYANKESKCEEIDIYYILTENGKEFFHNNLS